ncbi:MAG: endolytic transglycosylase MltG, partial [Bacteroidota bacterium]
DRSLIASVYLNRLRQRMPLQACPTIKFALKDFSLTRIYEKYLTIPSPYNTYQRAGLPPGPICTPLPATIDRVLNAPKTNYLWKKIIKLHQSYLNYEMVTDLIENTCSLFYHQKEQTMVDTGLSEFY